MRLYGKDKLKELLDSAAAENRLSHAVLLCGERGSGRRVTANYIAKLFLCKVPPCESCAVCSKINADAHPDVIFVKRECGGKYGLSTGKGLVSVREIMKGVAVKPNDGDIKVYIFEDADELSPQVQNTLLKIIEEPEPWLRFVFLCENAGSLLTTVRSRVTAYDVPLPSPAECAACLVNEHGVPAEKARELAEMMTGNIGKALEVLNGGEETRLMECAGRAAAGIAKKSGYAVCAALSEQTGRAEYAGVLAYLTGILRDAVAVRAGEELTSCAKPEARDIAGVYDEAAVCAMIDAVTEVASAGQLNINLALSSAYLTSRLIPRG